MSNNKGNNKGNNKSIRKTPIAMGIAAFYLCFPAFGASPPDAGKAATEVAVERTQDRMAGTPSGITDQMIDEVIVTATKREKRLQDVPIAITVLSEKTLELRGIKKTEDYLASLPGLSLLKDGTGSPSFTVRGIGTGTGTQTTAAPAGLYIDNYPVFDTWARFATTDLNIFDIERIEVLRGPQGTLFGPSSLSGAMRIITNKPDSEAFDAKIEVTGAGIKDGGNDYAVNAMVNQPLSTETALRVVAYERRDGGWIDNWAQDKDNVNSVTSTGARIGLSQQVTPKLKVLGTLTYQKNIMDDGFVSYYYPPAGRDKDQWKAQVPSNYVMTKLQLGELSADYDLDWATVTMYAQYGKNDSQLWGDYTNHVKLFGLDIPTIGNPGLTHSEAYTFEARLASKGEGALQYTVGAYHSTRERSLFQLVEQPALIPVVGTANIFNGRSDNQTDETALFGEATYRFAEHWSATAGMRASRNEFRIEASVNGLLTGSQNVVYTDSTSTESAVTPKFVLSYQPDSETNAYVSASKGYRYGLTNYYVGALNADSGIDLPYDSDWLWNYELGLKKSLLDGKLVSNSALYYIDWNEIQFGYRNALNLLYTTNAGDAKAYGFEQELSYRPNNAWEVNLAFAISKAEMAADSPRVQRRGASARGPAILGIKKGDRMPGAPEATLSAGVQYNIPDVMGGNAHVRLDTAYVGSSYIDFMEEGSLKIGGYTTANLRLGYTRGNYDWVVYASNLFNSRGITNAAANADLIGLTDAAYRVKPLTLGVTMRYQY